VIDIHHHCLPGVDDGPREWDEAVAMCRMAGDEGIETIIATPHVLRGRWRDVPRPELESRLGTLAEKTGGVPRLVLGSEYFFGHDAPEVLRAGTPVIPLARSRYVLLELPANSVPPRLDQPFYRMQLDGWVPIIAHPERNLVFQDHPELLVSLIEHGARVQITAGSLLGDFGTGARRAAEAWIRRGMVHFLATDAHNVTKRPPRVRKAIEAVQDLAGAAVATALTEQNPAAVVQNQPLKYVPEPSGGPPPGFLTRLGAFFGRR
jgi:protein-tyrosine phosphatase